MTPVPNKQDTPRRRKAEMDSNTRVSISNYLLTAAKLCLFFLLLVPAKSFCFESIVVLPFTNGSKSQQVYWLGEGFAESISEELMLENAYVIQRARRKAVYDELRLPYIGYLSRATMRKIGFTLGADYVVFGSYHLQESQLNVEIRVIRMQTSQLSDPITAGGPLEDLYGIHKSLIESLQDYFQSHDLHPTENHHAVRDPVPLHAYELYIKGLLETNADEKLSFFQRAVESHENYPEATYRIGLILSQQGRFEESTKKLMNISFPGVWLARSQFLIGVNFFRAKDYASALKYWTDLLQTHETSEIHNNIGIALLHTGEMKTAQQHFEAAVRLSPGEFSHLFNLAICLSREDMFKEAVEYLLQASRLQPGDYQCYYLLMRSLERLGDPVSKRVQVYFHDTLPVEEKGKFPELYTSVLQLLRLSASYLTRGERQYVDQNQERERSTRGDYINTYRVNARNELQRKSPDRAILEIKKGLSLSPFDSDFHFLWGMAYDQQKLREEAITELQFSIWCRDEVQSRILLAEIFRDQKKFAEAKEQVQQILAMDPDNKEATEIWNKIWNKQ